MNTQRIAHVTMRDRLWEILNRDARKHNRSTNAHIREILASHFAEDPEITPRAKPRRFTNAERRYIKENARFNDDGRCRNLKEVAAALDRPPTSVSRQIDALGIRPFERASA